MEAISESRFEIFDLSRSSYTFGLNVLTWNDNDLLK